MSRAVQSEDNGRNWPNVFTPATLAAWWECSERHVRNLIDSGELRAFRLGGKLWRIRPQEVEAFECQSGDLPASEVNTASHGQTHQSRQDADVIALEQTISKRRPAAPRLDTQNSLGRQERL